MKVPVLLPAALLLLGALAPPASASNPNTSGTASTDLPDQVSFTEHIAPVFMARCVTCHRPNDVAPMSLLSYAEARPWAKSIRQEVQSRQMPPWDADPRFGEFANDISLSDREVELILRWVDQGAVEGDPAKMPPPPSLPPAGSWKMGKQPDYVVDLQPIEVAAGGPDSFITQVYAMELPPGKWVRAIELLPGNTAVLHHVVTYLGPFGIGEEDESTPTGIRRTLLLNEGARRPIGMAEAPSIGGVWVAGSPPTVFPEGTGHPLQATQLVSLNMHYHPSGTAGVDGSKLGFYFGVGELEKEITTAFAADPGIWIPAGASDHHERAVYWFSQDSRILSLLPHMHQRGKSMKYTLVRPDGIREVLLDVPKYEYDWQNIYRFREPVAAPAGSLVEVEASWDNSSTNPANPDPKANVPWGDGTDFEMLVGFVDFVVDEGVKPRAVRGKDQIAALLARHDPRHAFTVTAERMGFGGPLGLVLPPEGDGWLYMGLGNLMFSVSIPGIIHLGDELLLNAGLLTSGGGTRLPLGFAVRSAEDGTISGEMFFGRVLDSTNIDTLRGHGSAFNGVSVAAAAATASSSAGR